MFFQSLFWVSNQYSIPFHGFCRETGVIARALCLATSCVNMTSTWCFGKKKNMTSTRCLLFTRYQQYIDLQHGKYKRKNHDKYLWCLIDMQYLHYIDLNKCFGSLRTCLARVVIHLQLDCLHSMEVNACYILSFTWMEEEQCKQVHPFIFMSLLGPTVVTKSGIEPNFYLNQLSWPTYV